MISYTMRVRRDGDELAVVVKDSELPRKDDILSLPLEDKTLVCQVYSIRRRLSFTNTMQTQTKIAVYKETNVSVHVGVVEERLVSISESDLVEVARDLPEFNLNEGDRGVVDEIGDFDDERKLYTVRFEDDEEVGLFREDIRLADEDF